MSQNTIFRPILLIATALAFSTAAAETYFPDRHEWQHRPPEAAGMDPEKLADAVEYAKEQAETEPADLRGVITESFEPREPDFEILGPVRNRPGSSGMILRDGYVVAEWGDVDRVDMTFSVTKSYLSTTAALALDDGLIENVDDRVGPYLQDGRFTSDHNQPITWRTGPS